MTPDIFWLLVQSELSNLPVTCTQMIAVTDFVSRPWIGFLSTLLQDILAAYIAFPFKLIYEFLSLGVNKYS